MITFEGYERRIDKINSVLKENGIASLEEAKEICTKKRCGCGKNRPRHSAYCF